MAAVSPILPIFCGAAKVRFQDAVELPMKSRPKPDIAMALGAVASHYIIDQLISK